MPSFWQSLGGVNYRNLVTGELRSTFVPNVSRPFYTLTQDFSGSRNVGTAMNTALTTYSGPIVDGVATLTDSALYENVLFPCVVDLRSPVTLRNCRIVVPTSYTTTADTIKACVRSLNGGVNAGGAVLENCEIHNRAQRPLNAVSGRNITIKKSVITGTVDGISDSTAGSAPLNFGYVLEDSIIADLAWWYSPTSNPDIHNPDTHSHSDGIQKGTTLSGVIRNTVIAAYASDYVGTGTPGAGSETNAYRPPSGYQYIASQAQQETWRAQRLAFRTTASQTMTGDVRKLPTRGEGSFAGIMMNLGNLTVENSYLGGGVTTVNAVDPDIIDSTVHFVNNTFYNDMVNGPSARTTDPTVYGNAVQHRSGASFGTFTGNKHADGTPLVQVDEGGFRLWR